MDYTGVVLDRFYCKSNHSQNKQKVDIYVLSILSYSLKIILCLLSSSKSDSILFAI